MPLGEMFKRHRLDLGEDYSSSKKSPSDGYVTLALPKKAFCRCSAFATGCFVVLLLISRAAFNTVLASLASNLVPRRGLKCVILGVR